MSGGDDEESSTQSVTEVSKVGPSQIVQGHFDLDIVNSTEWAYIILTHKVFHAKNKKCKDMRNKYMMSVSCVLCMTKMYVLLEIEMSD